MGSAGSPGRLPGELTEFVGRRAELALAQPALEIGQGGQIRYVQRIGVPDERRCLCLFEAIGPEVVRAVNDIAQFPLARVVAVDSSVPPPNSVTNAPPPDHG